MTAEIVAEMLAAPMRQDVVDEVKKWHDALRRPLSMEEVKEIFDSKLHDITKISELTGALSGLLTGDARGVSAAGTSSSTALNNNFLVAAAPLLWVAAEAALAELGTTGVVVASAAAGGYALHKATAGGDAAEVGDSAGEKIVEGGGAKVPVGRRGNPIEVKPGTNAPAEIGGRKYTGHSLDRMQGRGVPPSAVEETIKNGVSKAGKESGTIEHNLPGIKVITNSNGDVVTVFPR